MTYGITLIALGYESYGSCAFNMAMSLKSYDPHIRVCILHDNKAINHLSQREKSFFDQMIILPEEEYTLNGRKYYHRAKLVVNKYTPFDFTIYMDVDGLWFPDIKPSWLLGELLHDPFKIGMMGKYSVNGSRTNPGYTLWGEPDQIIKYHKIKEFLPNTVSGFFSFHKKGISEEIFRLALLAYDDLKAPCLVWAGGKPDEYAFNVALGQLSFRQAPYHVFYFHKTNGMLSNAEIYERFWGIATGGATCPDNVVHLYNKLIDKYSVRAGIENRHYHINKSEVVTERK